MEKRRNVLERAPSLQRLDTPRQGEAGGGERLVPAGTNDDARTLWIDWDGQGERYEQLDHAGLALGGEGTALHMAKMTERQGGDPCLWAERWLRETGIERDSRTGHELSVLTNAFYQGGIYDQLDAGGLGSLDVSCRCIAVLVEAHSEPSRPNGAAARYLDGAPMSEEVILPGLRSYVLRKLWTSTTLSRGPTLAPLLQTTRTIRRAEGKGANKKGRRGRVLSAPDG